MREERVVWDQQRERKESGKIRMLTERASGGRRYFKKRAIKGD
jgi:hypothetical protein